MKLTEYSATELEEFLNHSAFLETIVGLSSCSNPTSYFLACVEQYFTARFGNRLESTESEILRKLMTTMADVGIISSDGPRRSVDPDTMAVERMRWERCSLKSQTNVPEVVNAILDMIPNARGKGLLARKSEVKAPAHFVQIMHDYTFYQNEYQKYLNELSQFLPRMSVHFIVITDDDRIIVPTIRPSCKYKIHLMNETEFAHFSKFASNIVI